MKKKRFKEEYVAKHNNSPNQRFDDLISIAVVLLFVFGFFVLVEYGGVSVIGLTGIDFVSEAVYYGTDASSWFGSPLAPTNRTRTIDDRTIDFIFNISAEGLHNTSKLTDHCVGNYWFEQNSTNYADPTINNLTISGNIANVSGIVGYAYSFDGISDYARVENKVFNSSESFSIVGWVYSDSARASGVQTFVSKITGFAADDYGFSFRTDQGGGWAQLSTPNGTDQNAMLYAADMLDKWIHAGITFDDSTNNFSMYIDGIIRNSDIIANATNAKDQYLTFGSLSYATSANELNGSIDEVLVFNRTLSVAEISAIYNDGLSGGTSTVENCSLLLNIDGGGYSVNKTLVGTVAHNTSGVGDNCVGNWWFEEDAGEDQTGINNGTLSGDIINTTGIVGYGYDFEGNADYITVENSLGEIYNNSHNNTLCFWFNKKGESVEGSNNYMFVQHVGGTPGNRLHILTQTDNDLDFIVGSASSFNVFSFNNNEWHQTCLVVTNNTFTAYGDGSEIISETSYTHATTLADVTFGYTTNTAWNGSIDEVLIFNRTLLAAEIKAIYEDANTSMLNLEGYNSTIQVDSFAYAQHDIDWKIGCYDSYGGVYNSSEMYLELDALVTQSEPNIGAHAYYDRNYVVGQWRFEEHNGTDFKDETGLNNGTISGGVKWCPDWGDSQKWNCSGRVGKGVHFDGTGYITTTFSDFTSEMTYSGWAQIDSTGATRAIWSGTSAGTSPMLRLEAAGTSFTFFPDVGGGLTAAFTYTPTLSKWFHWALVFDEGVSATLYIDGAFVSTDTTVGSYDASPGTLVIGMRATSLDPMIGNEDELTIWNRSLSAEEVKTLYYSSYDTYNSTFTIQDISASNNNTEDEDNDTIKFIYDWYVNNESMAVLNMPFEAVNNGSEMNFTKDYSDNENHGSTNFNDDNFQCIGSGSTRSCSGWNRTGGYDGFGAYEFDGDGDLIDMTPFDNISGVGALSVSAWIKFKETFDGYDGVIAIGKQTERTFWLYGLDTDTALRANIGTPTSNTDISLDTSSLTANQWYHIAVTWDGTNGELFVDGSSVDTDTSTSDSTANSTGTDYIGYADGLSYWNGTIDEVLIFNRSLSAEQIKALYYNQTQTIKSQETVKGQSWKAEVTANDGYGDSIEYNTSEIIIDSVTLEVHSIYPANMTVIHDDNIVNFTYNVTDGGSVGGVQNCSLYLGYGGAHANSINSTDNVIEGTGVNQSFNITFTTNITHEVRWLVGCWDKDNEQTNSTEGVIKFQRNELVTQSAPNIGAHAFVDENYVVGSWRFEEFNGSDYYDETGLNNGTISGGVKWCPDGGDSQKYNCSGRIGKGVMFDGDDDYIDLPNYINVTAGYSMSAWVYTKGMSAAQNCILCTFYMLYGAGAGYKGWGLWINSEDDVYYKHYNSTGFAWLWISNLAPMNNWHHIAVTYDDTDISLYLNGDLGETVSTNMSDLKQSVYKPRIGSDAYLALQDHNGSIDEITVWNRTLSTEEIKQLYYSSAVSYNSTFTIQDISASNNNTEDEDNDTIKFIYDWMLNDYDYLDLPQQSNLVSFWGLDGSGIDSKGDNDGVVTGATLVNPGWRGSGFEFDGNNDNINVGDITELNSASAFSMSFWMNQDVLDQTDVIFIKGSGADVLELWTHTDGRMTFYISGSTNYGYFDYSTVINALNWHHVTWVFDGSQSGTNADTLKVFVDGVEQTLTFSGTVEATTDDNSGQDAYIGYTTVSWDGKLDEFALWDKALTSGEISTIYNNSRFRSIAVLNMPFEAVNNGSEMNFSKDYSDNENHGSTNFNDDNFQCIGSGSTRSCSGWNRTGGYDGFGAYEFDGDGDYIGIADDSSLSPLANNGEMTIALWIKPKTLVNEFVLIKGGDPSGWEYGIIAQPTGFVFDVWTSAGTSICNGDGNLDLNVDKWTFLTLTAEYGVNCTAYINGQFDYTVTNTTQSWADYADGGSKMNIGRRSGVSHFNGTIDEVLIFNRSLSAEQIKALYYNQTQTIKSAETVKGQSWKAEVTANDGYGDSIEYNTSEIIIDSVTLNVKSLAPNNDTTITCLNSVNFTYNVTDNAAVAGIQNCSLYLGYDTANANQLNKTDHVIENNQNQTFNLTFTVNDTWIYWKIGCYDKDDEQTNSSLRRFYLSSICPPAPPREPSPGSSSGMGSSGERKSSTITEIRQTITGNVYSLDYIVPGITVLEISDPGLSVYKLELDIGRELEDVGIILNEGKTSFISKPKERVYRYVDIRKNNLPDSAVNEIVIWFKVQKGFGDEIKMMHYVNDWEELESEKVDEDEYYEYYKARSHSMSMFSIVGIDEKKSFVKIFTPGLITDVEVTGFFVRLKEYVGVSLFSFTGLVCMILLFIFVRSRLKKKVVAKVKTTKKRVKHKRKVKRKPRKRKVVKKVRKKVSKKKRGKK